MCGITLFASAFSPPYAPLLIAALLLAMLIDRLWGEPPTWLHPVVAMGHYLDAIGRRIAPTAAAQNRQSANRLVLLGGLAWGLGAGLVVLLALVLQLLLMQLQGAYALLGILALAFLLKPMFAYRMLRTEVEAVEAALQISLAAGQKRLSYLVSRDTHHLNAVQVREAAIETLAENFNDSFIAPLFWFCVGGLPAAALYRYANTADASWGYMGARGGRDWTHAGRFAARADDVLSWLPARITALLILIAARAGLTALNIQNTLKEARKTPSPNSGWPMAAMALVLDVSLGKPGVYRLHPPGHAPQATDLHAALAIAARCWRLVLLLATLSLLAALYRYSSAL